MKIESQLLLNKAQETIDAGEALVRGGFNDIAAGRAYYAMFYIAEALLNEKDLRFSKHSGVHSAFSLHFIKTGLFDPKYHRWLLDSFDQRMVADYHVGVEFSAAEAGEILRQAREFLAAAEEYIAAVD